MARKRRPGPHYVDLRFETSQGLRDFKSLAFRSADLGDDAPYELGRESDAPEGWVIPSSPEKSYRFLEVLRSYGGRVVSSRPASRKNPKDPYRGMSSRERKLLSYAFGPNADVEYWRDSSGKWHQCKGRGCGPRNRLKDKRKRNPETDLARKLRVR